MNGPKLLSENIGRVKSSVGGFFPGSHVIFRGQDLHADLRGMDWMELYVFGITGRRFTTAQVKLLHALWTYTSYPDVRIWNNRVAGLAGSVRSTPGLGMSAALAVSESTIFGANPCVRAIDFLIQARNSVANGSSLKDVISVELEQRHIYGYGRPLVLIDERLPWLRTLAAELCLDKGPHFGLAFEVEALLVERDPRLKMNYAALVAALGADLGFTVREFHHFQLPMLLAGMNPCFIEATSRPIGSLFPLPCDHLQYEGPASRAWRSSEE